MVGSRGGGKGSRAKRQQTQPQSGPQRRQTIGSIQRSLDLGSRSISHDCSSYRRRLVLNSIRLRFSRGLPPLVCCSYRIFCASAVGLVRKRRVHKRPGYLTDLVRKPLLSHVVGIPNITRKVRGLLVHIYKFDQLCIQMRVSKRPVHHQRVVEMLWRVRIVFERVELHQLRLQTKRDKRTDFPASYAQYDGTDLDLRITWFL